MAYIAFGGLPWMQAVVYGVGAAVIGIIAMSSYKLTIKSVGKFTGSSIRSNWMLWVIYTTGVAITVIMQSEEALFFVAAGLLYMFVKAPPAWIKKPPTANTLFLAIGFWQLSGESSVK